MSLKPPEHRLKHGRFLIEHVLSNPRKGAEIGVDTGVLTEQLLEAFPDLHMTAVDPWCFPSPYDGRPGEIVYQEYLRRTVPYGDRVRTICGWSPDAAGIVDAASLDFVFIDADHRVARVLADIRAWRPKVKPGGILAGHDYCDKYPGVKMAVDRLAPEAEVHDATGVWWTRC